MGSMTRMNESLRRYLDRRLAELPNRMSLLVQGLRGVLHAPTATRALHGVGGGPLFEAEAALRQHHPLWVRRLVEILPTRWQAEIEPAARAGGRSLGLDTGIEGLSLVDESAAEENVELLRIVERCEGTHEALLRELQARSATLCGHDSVKRRSNPLRPDLMVRAVWDAAEVLGLQSAGRQVLLRALAEPLLKLLGGLYADALAELEAEGIEPAAWRATSLPGRRLPGAVASGYDLTRPGALDGLRVRMAGHARATPTGVARDERLDAAVQRILAVAVPTHGGDPLANRLLDRLPLLEAAAVQRADRQLIELIAQLVEAMLRDPALPHSVRCTLARLQAPLLRVALTDERLLDDLHHPAWQLLNRLGAHTIGFDDDDDPRLWAVAQAVDDLFAGIASSARADAGVFAAALRELDALIAADLAAECEEAQGALTHLRHAERRAALQLGIKRELQSRFELATVAAGAASALPVLRRFFMGRWVEGLAESVLRDGPDAASSVERRGLIDDLLLTLAPWRGEAERQTLLQRVPGVVQRLQRGFAAMDVPAVERQAVLDTLMHAHTELLRPGGGAPATAPTPEEIVRRLREEPDDVADPEDAPPAGESLYDVATLDTVPAALLDDGPSGAAPQGWLQHLRPGTWCRLVARGHWTVARLLWVSPSREHWLFSDADVGRTHALTRRAVERLVQEQLATPLEQRSLLERAVDGVLGAHSAHSA